MITIEGLCDQLRRYNESTGREHVIHLKPDTSGALFVITARPEDLGVKAFHFGNPYQLMEYFTKHTGVRK